MLDNFKFWCYKVLPLVYDDSLSYYEVLCKVVDYINKLIEQDKVFGDELVTIKKALAEVEKWIANYDSGYLEDIIANYLAKMIYVDISDSGHIIYNIPNSWKDVTFNTTGLDINNEELSGNGHVANYEYGRLVLSLWTEV